MPVNDFGIPMVQTKKLQMPRNLKIMKQRGKSDYTRDVARIAAMPGKRISSTGKIYWETRKNRSDKKLGMT